MNVFSTGLFLLAGQCGSGFKTPRESFSFPQRGVHCRPLSVGSQLPSHKTSPAPPRVRTRPPKLALGSELATMALHLRLFGQLCTWPPNWFPHLATGFLRSWPQGGEASYKPPDLQPPTRPGGICKLRCQNLYIHISIYNINIYTHNKYTYWWHIYMSSTTPRGGVTHTSSATPEKHAGGVHNLGSRGCTTLSKSSKKTSQNAHW